MAPEHDGLAVGSVRAGVGLNTKAIHCEKDVHSVVAPAEANLAP